MDKEVIDRYSSPVTTIYSALYRAFIARRAHTWERGGDRKGWHCVDSSKVEESRGRRQNQNALTERQIQDAQTAFLCLVDGEMLIHIQGCAVAEARRVLGDDCSTDMSVDELTAFLALVYVREVKGGRNMELSSFWSD
ncbi:hypothetical protein AMECASPLE_027432 [Ameca splendens]|uniref:Uncharacterized protein n=1 Tax=Ameca splendens TaxID=208324 RepID=A0ABV0Z3Z9_9TELE